MELQNFELKNQKIKNKFLKMKKEDPRRFRQRLNLSWSNWGFGREELPATAKRLKKNKIKYIELHGNRYGPDLGYDAKEVKKILTDNGIKAAGICGMYSPDSELASNRGTVRQNAMDYIRRNVDLGQKLGVGYFLIAPAAVGRPEPIDDMEFERSADTLRQVADVFTKSNIKGAVEPIRSAEVSLCHTVKDALGYIKAVNHPGVQHINGDVYHMQVEEPHIGEAILQCKERLTNLHMADSNRCALGDGSLDLDTIIMALYIIGYNRPGCYVTPEPLGPGGDPYPAMHGKPDKARLDQLVKKTVSYIRRREEEVVSL